MHDSQSLGWRVLVALTVIVASLVLVASGLIFGVEVHTSPEQDRASERTTTETTTAAPEPVPGAGPTATGNAEVDEAMTELARFVEQERGLAFQRPVDVELLDEQAFEQRLLEAEQKDADDLRTAAEALQALGFVDSVDEILRGQHDLLVAGVLGFYDPETDELVVRGTALTPMTRQTVAHELTHALDDQWFELGSPEFDESEDEVSFGVAALAEGNARRVDRAYDSSLNGAERQQLRQEQLGISPPAPSIPPVLFELIRAPYDFGEPLVGELLRHGGQAELDEAFRSPPRTSEQVLDPAKLIADEQAVPVDTPPGDGAVRDQGTFGELMWRLVLDRSLGRGRVNRATTGWGGDRYVVWQQGGEFCIRVDVAGDTPDDLTELGDALREAIRRDLPAAQLDRSQPDRLRLTSCN
jgi:hypothetical protein